ncbi:MAG: phosphoglucosamine mutase [Thermoanaerobaculia bacterium]
MKKLFGTDGIRGKALIYPLDKKTVYNLGRIVGRKLNKGKSFLIGIDTRESSPLLAGYLYSGLKKEGAESIYLGVISTPGLSWITKNLDEVEFSVMVSASHNPYEDNGLKFFSSWGTKLEDKEEEEIEKLLELEQEETLLEELPTQREDIKNIYKRWLLSLFPKNYLKGLKIVVDTANGSLSGFAQEIFLSYGAEVISIGDFPDGKNINLKVGSLYPETSISKLKENKYDLSICFDGDGDRVILTVYPDKILDGDDILYILALDLKEKGILRDGVVATSMSNLGFENALKEKGIKLYRTKVGDKFVFEELERNNLILGGEQSGHIILRHLSNTGDGLLVALHILEILKRKDFNFELFKKYPQKIINCPVKKRIPLEEIPSYKIFLKEIEEIMESGRVVIRYSGTEPLIRVMLEAEKSEKIEEAEIKAKEFLEKVGII